MRYELTREVTMTTSLKALSVLVCACLCAQVWADSPAPKLDADGVKGLVLPDVRIDSAVHHADGYVDVDGFIGGTIGFELLLPDSWNGRFTMGGGGGFVGSVQNMTRGSARQGYATVGTDTGHRGPGGNFALDDVLAQINFGHLAVHRTAEAAKAIIHAYYGSSPEFSYFLGCSRGGGQALMEAQRYPNDFDGIVAGAPAFNWTGFGATFLRIAQAFYPDPKNLASTVVDRDDLEKLYQEIMKQCDAADGLEDGIVDDPTAVKFDLSKVSGLTDAQRKAIQAVYDGARNSDGPIYPGFPIGAEGGPQGWLSWITGPLPAGASGGAPSASFGFGTDIFRYFVFNDPDWDYTKYDFSTWAEDTHLAGTFLNATDPKLDAYKARGGKLIIWHGWADPALPATATIGYYDDVLEVDSGAMDYTRLYMVPGCLHCGGGPGPSGVDWLDVISKWVEKGEAPGRLVATKGQGDAAMTRPLYPYPNRSAYKGSGDPNKAENFDVRKP